MTERVKAAIAAFDRVMVTGDPEDVKIMDAAIAALSEDEMPEFTQAMGGSAH